MDELKRRFRKLRSYLGEVVVERVESQKNGVLEVCLYRGRYVLNSQNANYSYAGLHKLFQKVFRKIKLTNRKIRNVLLLGLGAGSVVHILRKEYDINAPINAVEYGEDVLRLGKKYFNTDTWEDLQVHNMDAGKYVKEAETTFDLVVIDLFDDNRVPPQFFNLSFLTQVSGLVASGGVLVFNIMIHNEAQKEQVSKMKNLLTKSGRTTLISMMVTNTVLIWERN